MAQEQHHEFPRVFWTANVTELFERAAYYSMASFVVIYLGQLGLGAYWPSNLNSVLWTLVYFLPILSGTIADQVGFRRSLLVAFVLLAVGYSLMGYPVWFGGADAVARWCTRSSRPPRRLVAIVLLAILLIGAGGSVIKPCISGTVQKTSGALATLGFAIFYMVINIGSLFGRGTAFVVRNGSARADDPGRGRDLRPGGDRPGLPGLPDAPRRARSKGNIWPRRPSASPLMVAAAGLLIAWIYRLRRGNARGRRPGAASPTSSRWPRLPRWWRSSSCCSSTRSRRRRRRAGQAASARSGASCSTWCWCSAAGASPCSCVVISGFFFLYNQVYNVLPLYCKRVVETSPAMDLYTAANPFVIVCFQLLVTRMLRQDEAGALDDHRLPW